MIDLNTLPERLLLGPGPSNAHPRVLDALSRPLLGHLDPLFIELLNEVCLLYSSDAADEEASLHVGVRRLITQPTSL